MSDGRHNLGQVPSSRGSVSASARQRHGHGLLSQADSMMSADVEDIQREGELLLLSERSTDMGVGAGSARASERSGDGAASRLGAGGGGGISSQQFSGLSRGFAATSVGVHVDQLPTVSLRAGRKRRQREQARAVEMQRGAVKRRHDRARAKALA